MTILERFTLAGLLAIKLWEKKGKKRPDRDECFTKTLRAMYSYRLNVRSRKYKKHLAVGEGH